MVVPKLLDAGLCIGHCFDGYSGISLRFSFNGESWIWEPQGTFPKTVTLILTLTMVIFHQDVMTAKAPSKSSALSAVRFPLDSGGLDLLSRLNSRILNYPHIKAQFENLELSPYQGSIRES